MGGENKSSELAVKMMEVATTAVKDMSADVSDAVQASLITTMTLARMCSPIDPSDDEFDAFVDDMSAVMLRHVTKWNAKGGSQ